MEEIICRAYKIYNQMNEEGKVQILSYDESISIERELADAMREIKAEFENKEKNSRIYAASIELNSIKA